MHDECMGPLMFVGGNSILRANQNRTGSRCDASLTTKKGPDSAVTRR